MEFSKVLLSTNQNRPFLIRKFLTILISTNQNNAFTQYGVFNTFGIKQSSVPSQIKLLVLTKQNEVFSDFEKFSDQNKTTKFMNFPYQSVLFTLSKLTNKNI